MSIDSVRAFFAEKAPEITVIESATSSATVTLAAEAYGVEPGRIAKTLSLRVGDRVVLIVTSGTSLTQPLSELWKIKSANDVAAAQLKETRGKARQTENEVALRVHQLYYRILVLQSHKEAAQAKIHANEALQAERVQQVKFGSTLEEEAIESRAQSLEAKQDLLTTELQLSDLAMQLSDAIGLPLNTPLTLDPTVRQVANTCELEQCLRAAMDDRRH